MRPRNGVRGYFQHLHDKVQLLLVGADINTIYSNSFDTPNSSHDPSLIAGNQRELTGQWLYLRASSDGDDASEEVSYHRLQGGRQAIYVDGVDQTQAVLFKRWRKTQIKGQKLLHLTRSNMLGDIRRGFLSYPVHLSVIESGHQHQALGGKDLGWLDDGQLLVGLIHLAGLGFLQRDTVEAHITAAASGWDKHLWMIANHKLDLHLNTHNILRHVWYKVKNAIHLVAMSFTVDMYSLSKYCLNVFLFHG